MDAVLARSAIRRFERPADLTEVLSLLQHSDGTARLLGGGTDLALHPPAGVTTLVDLGGLPLDYVQQRTDAVAVGGTTTLAAMAEAPAVAGLAGGLLAEVLVHIGSHALRNIATIGGHLARGRLSDLVPALLALDAAVTLYDGATHTMPLTELYDAGWHRRPMVLTEVLLPLPPTTATSGFVRFSRTAFDYALLNCAAVVDAPAGTIAVARVAVGETPALARRVVEVEQFLAGRALDEGTVDEAARLAQEHVVTAADQRASAEYRRHLVGVGLRRALRHAAGTREVEP